MERDNFSRLQLVFAGARSDAGNMRLRTFGYSIAAFDELYEGVSRAIGLTRAEIRITADLERGSIVVQLLTLADVQTVAQALATNQQALAALESVIETVATVGTILGGAILFPNLALKQYYERIKARLEKDAALRRERDDTLAEDRLNDLAIRRLAEYSSNPDVALLVKSFVDPLTTGEAETIRIQAGNMTFISLAQGDVKRPQVAAAAGPAERLGEALEIEETLTVLAAQFDGRANGWRFRTESKVFSAIVRDGAFLAEVRDGKWSFAERRSIRAIVRWRRLGARLTRPEIIKVLSQSQAN